LDSLWGETDQWACEITKDGTEIWNKSLRNGESKLALFYHGLTPQSTMMVVADQAATIGALTVAVSV